MSMLKPDNTLASVHIIQKRIERVVFVVSIISTVLFLSFYAYMIYSRINDSIANTIIYSIMSVILVVSLVFDTIFYIKSIKPLDYKEEKEAKQQKILKRRIVNSIKVIVKLSSLGYATYELIAIDNSSMKLFTLIFSYGIFAIQIISYFVADFTSKYFNYLYLGVTKDLEELYPIIHPLRGDEIIKANNDHLTQKELKILDEINDQKEEDEQLDTYNKKIKIREGKSAQVKKQKRIRGLKFFSGVLPATSVYKTIKEKREKNKKQKEFEKKRKYFS